MNFFESYADALALELNEDGSNFGDIVVDWMSLTAEENTAQPDDTSNNAVNQTNTTRPDVDGLMPNQPKRNFHPRTETDNTMKLRDIWPRSTKTCYTVHSEPMIVRTHDKEKPVVIIRKMKPSMKQFIKEK